jgi:hypothetical protein
MVTKVKLLVWKRNALLNTLYLIGVSTFLCLVIFLYDIGDKYNSQIFILTLTLSILALTINVYLSIGILQIIGNQFEISVKIRMCSGSKKVDAHIKTISTWWNYNFTSFSGQEIARSKGLANQLSLWTKLQLESGEEILIKEVLGNWSSAPKDWVYKLEEYNNSKFQLATIGSRKIKKNFHR